MRITLPGGPVEPPRARARLHRCGDMGVRGHHTLAWRGRPCWLHDEKLRPGELATAVHTYAPGLPMWGRRQDQV